MKFIKHRITHSFFFVKTSFRTLAYVIVLFRPLPKIHNHIGENGDQYRLKHQECFFDRFHFKTTEWCKARITALALPERTFNFLSCLSSLVNATPRYLNFSTSFNDTLPSREQDRIIER